jgi:hypothetical protein
VSRHDESGRALDVFARRYQDLIAERGTNYTRLAQATGFSRAYCSAAAKGREVPSEALVAELDAELAADGELLELRDRADRERTARRRRRAAHAPADGGKAKEVDETDRRDFNLAALSLTAIDILHRIGDDVGEFTLSEMESDVEEFAAVYDATPHAVLLPQVAARWQTVEERLDRGRISIRDLARAELLGGQFGYLLGRIAFASGRYREARRFADLSDRHARQVGDPLLTGSIAALRSSIAYYTGRYADAADIAARARPSAPKYLAARLAAYEARGWAAVERRDGTTEALRDMRASIIESAPLPGESPFSAGSADMFTAVCHVRLRGGREAEPYARAAIDGLAVSGSYEERGHACLALANAHLLRDRPDPAAAAHAGTRALDVPDGHLTSTLTAAASRVWDRIQPWADDADVHRFGERVASTCPALPAGGRA